MRTSQNVVSRIAWFILRGQRHTVSIPSHRGRLDSIHLMFMFHLLLDKWAKRENEIKRLL